MSFSYLRDLNPEQRRAAEYGSPSYADAGPLLIIAGAGSGKTNTLAHRVANLIVNGIDPRRILLLTFSRRAATEMIRRVERITASALGQNAGVMTGALAWSGTFHAVGARLLREHAHRIGLSPSFTIHDREDSADLLNLVRHDLGFSNAKKTFPDERYVLVNLFACRECREPTGGCAGFVVSMVCDLGNRAPSALCSL